ncbi:MAG: response regulator [Pseudomonadota bacterium]
MGERLLIIDDDHKLRKLLGEYLEGYGYETKTLPDGEDALKSLKEDQPEIVILDVMMPKKNGLEVLREIRRESRVPVIMLTAKGDDADRIAGLEMGADDYLPKPFNPRELLARIRAVMRRTSPDEERKEFKEDELRIEAGGLVLNRAKQTVTVDGVEMDLSSTEYKILESLMQRPDTVLTRDQLMNLARGRDFMAFDRSIDVHISKLRAKVERDPRSPRRIKTIWGSGYMFVDTP